MDRRTSPVDFDRLLRLRLVVARFGEMDGAMWWNTKGLLGRQGALLMSRSFAKTHHFAQARVVFSVATARSREVFDPPQCMTLWSLPAALEDQFDARWHHWLDAGDAWRPFFEQLPSLPATDLLESLQRFELVTPAQEEMRLAGELGSLLRIEKTLANVVGETDLDRRQRNLFSDGLESRDFWATADEKIVAALKRFAESAAGSAGVPRRLFAEDAAQGVAFIELMRKRFDVVLMNPPFGAVSLAAKKELSSSYPRTKNDLYAAFVERGIELLHPRGLLGAITSRTGFFLSSFQTWREEILLKQAPPTVFADLGYGVLDSAMVEVAAYCLLKQETT